MNRDEAKQILLLYRPGSADANDLQIAEALALAKQDQELAHWLEEHCARQESLRGKFRQISPPPGLKEQIISEHAARMRFTARYRAVALATAAVVALIALSVFWFRPPPDGTLAKYRSRMAGIALRGYSMDLESSDAVQIHAFLAQQQAPADYVWPAGLKSAVVTGCAIERWQGAKVAMICFRTGKPLPPGGKSDLWLFVTDRASLKNPPTSSSPEFAKVNKLITATWTQGDKVYLLGTVGDEQSIRSYL